MTNPSRSSVRNFLISQSNARRREVQAVYPTHLSMFRLIPSSLNKALVCKSTRRSHKPRSHKNPPTMNSHHGCHLDHPEASIRHIEGIVVYPTHLSMFRPIPSSLNKALVCKSTRRSHKPRSHTHPLAMTSCHSCLNHLQASILHHDGMGFRTCLLPSLRRRHILRAQPRLYHRLPFVLVDNPHCSPR